MKCIRAAALRAGLGIVALAAGFAAPAQAEVEFNLPDGQQVSAGQMAQALMEALLTADEVQRPLLLHALSKVLELPPEALLADSQKDGPPPVF